MERTDSVLVQGDLEKLTEDILTLYFSNKKRSGGGDVQSFIWINTRKSAAITFGNCDGGFSDCLQRLNIDLELDSAQTEAEIIQYVM